MEDSNAKKKLPIKEINYQDIYHLVELLEQLDSWQEPLLLLEKYFSDENRPLNKQKLVKQYYAQSKIFQAFLTDFQRVMPEIEKSMFSLSKRKKL